ncbi:MAG: hypothetical protein V4662_23735 [Verrucomicrobiota bacterium]
MTFSTSLPWLLALALVVWLGAGIAQAEIREFKDSAGRKVRAELVSHDGAGQITLKMESGTVFQKVANQFSAEDQLVIAEWMKRTPATVDYRFEIKVVAGKVAGERKNMGYKTVKNELWAYKVEIRNTARSVAKNLKVEYRVFVQEGAEGSFASDGKSGFHAGEATVPGPLRYNDAGTFSTREIPIDVVDYRYSTTRQDRHVDALKGLMLRILDAQGKVVHEWVSPITTLRGKTWDSIPKSLELK